MNLDRLRCFVAVAGELHFGRAAQSLDILPSALGRNIKLLEADLGSALFARTTRSVSLSADGAALLDDARRLIQAADALVERVRERRRDGTRTFRIGAIDTAAVGLIPKLLADLRRERPDLRVHLVEDKTIRLLPRLLSGGIDLAFVRPPPARSDKRLEFKPLFHETAVVAVPTHHLLARRRQVTMAALIDQPMIVPERRTRPHSHDLTMRLFAEAGTRPTIAQIAEEKQTIVNLVAAGIGLAIVPRWTSRIAVTGVRYLTLRTEAARAYAILPLGIAWARGSRDAVRGELIELLERRRDIYAGGA